MSGPYQKSRAVDKVTSYIHGPGGVSILGAPEPLATKLVEALNAAYSAGRSESFDLIGRIIPLLTCTRPLGDSPCAPDYCCNACAAKWEAEAYLEKRG